MLTRVSITMPNLTKWQMSQAREQIVEASQKTIVVKSQSSSQLETSMASLHKLISLRLPTGADTTKVQVSKFSN